MIITVILIVANLAGAFTFVENINPILMGFVIILVYMVLFVSPKFALYLFIDIRDQLKLIAQNTASQPPQKEQMNKAEELMEEEQNQETFLNKGIYLK